MSLLSFRTLTGHLRVFSCLTRATEDVVQCGFTGVDGYAIELDRCSEDRDLCKKGERVEGMRCPCHCVPETGAI